MDTLLTFADLTALVNPGMLHTIGELETKAAEGDDRLKISKPFG